MAAKPQDFFLVRGFRDLDDLNAQFEDRRMTIADPPVHATAQQVVGVHFAEEKPHLVALPGRPYGAVLTADRWINQECMVAVGCNQYRVPDNTRRRIVEVQSHLTEVCIFEDGQLIACHPVLACKNQKRVDPSQPRPTPRAAAVACLLRGHRSEGTPMIPVTERIRQSLVSLHMARALETLDQILS